MSICFRRHLKSYYYNPVQMLIGNGVIEQFEKSRQNRDVEIGVFLFLPFSFSFLFLEEEFHDF